MQRRRIQEELEKAGDSRIERESVRASKYFGELLEESEKKRQKTPEGQGGDPVQGGREGDDLAVAPQSKGDRVREGVIKNIRAGDGQVGPEVQPRAREGGGHEEGGQPEKRARQEEGGASSSSCGPATREEAMGEAAPTDDERGTKRNEDDWMSFAMNLRKRAKQGPNEDESEMEAVDVVNWINAVLEEGRPEEEEEAWP